MLGNYAIADNKPAFLDFVASSAENWSLYAAFTFTKETSHALVTTLIET